MALACVGCGSGGPAPPFRVGAFHTVLQDDDLALYNPAALSDFIAKLRYLGVDVLRVSAEWKLEVPDPNAARPPAGFDASDPHAYDGSPSMQALDRAVRAASGAGIAVIIDPAFSAPRWATSNGKATGGGDHWYNWQISIPELVRWEAMLAQRYSGHYTPSGASSPLPRVRFFTLWNEPNQSGFLGPQWSGGVPVSADWYRQLLRAAYPAIKRASPSAQILIGNTSSTGGDPQAGNGGVPPVQFIERMACVNAQLRPLNTDGCRGFTTLPADGYAQHPYERDAPPWVADPGRGFAEMGDLPILQRLLDRLVALHRLAPGGRQIWLTEQGYGSNDELPGSPWNDAQQAQLNAVSEYLAWRDHVASFSQFLLRDTGIAQTQQLRARTGNPRALVSGTWTTGLEMEDGAPKPALAMFRTPIVVRALSGGAVEVWARIRPARRPTSVVVQLSTGGAWTDVSHALTDANGIFDLRVGVSRGRAVAIRFRWRDSSGNWETSPWTVPSQIPLPPPG